MKKLTLLTAIFLLISLSARAQVFSSLQLEFIPGAAIPITSTTDDFSTSFGVSSNFSIAPFSEYFRFGFSLGYGNMNSVAENSLHMGVFALLTEVDWDLGNYVNLFANLRLGGLYGSYLGSGGAGLYGSASGGVRFHVMPELALGLGASYSLFSISGGYNMNVIDVFGSVSFKPFGSGSRSKIDIDDIIIDPIFPILYKHYEEHDFGTISLQNKEGKSLKDVEVSFFIDRYMDQSVVIAQKRTWAPGEKWEVPLHALFNENILNLTEATKTAGVINIKYNTGQIDKEYTHNETFRILNRNNLTWDDDRKIAAFVSPTDPTVLKLAKATETSIRSDNRIKSVPALRSAISVFETMRLLGISYVIDPNSSYEDQVNLGALDYVQFPRQTIDYLAGDCDDLSVLFNALIMAAGHEAAFITIPGHIYSAVSTGISISEMNSLFGGNHFIEYERIAWIPVEITLLDASFNRAWALGLREWKENKLSGKAEIYPVSKIWNEAYEAVGPYSDALNYDVPSRSNILNRFDINMNLLLKETIEPQIDSMLSGNENQPRILNRAAVMYGKYGMYDKSETLLKQALNDFNYNRALINLGNIYTLKNDETEAERFYKLAADEYPRNAAVKISLARLYHRQGRLDEADRFYQDAVSLDEDLAVKYAYLRSDTEQRGTRAGEVQFSNPLSLEWGDE